MNYENKKGGNKMEILTNNNDQMRMINQTYYYMYIIHKKFERLKISKQVEEQYFYDICQLTSPLNEIPRTYFRHMIWTTPMKSRLAYFLLEEGYTWREMQKIVRISPTKVRQFIKKNPSYDFGKDLVLWDENERNIIAKVHPFLTAHIKECKQLGYNLI
jgi:hypothetical protein